jgi:transposase
MHAFAVSGAGKNRPAGDTARHVTAPDVKDLQSESASLKEVVAELMIRTAAQKSILGDRDDSL